MRSGHCHCCSHLLVICCGLFLTCLQLAWTVCLKPATPDYAYSLSESKASYDTDFTYEIVCIPAYTLVGDDEMLCMPSGQWNSSIPECSPSVGQYPWWMLLIGLLGAMLVIVCIVPRVFHIFLDERHVAHLKSLKVKKGGLDVDMDKDDEEDQYAGEEQANNMDIMEKHYGDDIDMEQMGRAKASTAF